MKKTGATFMLIGSIIWLITVMWGLIRGLSSTGASDMPAEGVLFLIVMIIIPVCFLMASIFFLVDDNNNKDFEK